MGKLKYDFEGIFLICAIFIPPLIFLWKIWGNFGFWEVALLLILFIPWISALVYYYKEYSLRKTSSYFIFRKSINSLMKEVKLKNNDVVAIYNFNKTGDRLERFIYCLYDDGEFYKVTDMDRVFNNSFNLENIKIHWYKYRIYKVLENFDDLYIIIYDQFNKVQLPKENLKKFLQEYPMEYIVSKDNSFIIDYINKYHSICCKEESIYDLVRDKNKETDRIL